MTTSAVADVRASDAALGVVLGVAVSCGWVVAIVYAGGASEEAPQTERIAVKVAAVSRPAPRRGSPQQRSDRSVAQTKPLPAPPPVPKAPRSPSRASKRSPAPRGPAIDDLPAPEETSEGPALPGVLDEPEGEGDPAGDAKGKAAIAAYRNTLRRWLAARYKVRGSGLPADELAGKKVRLVLRIDSGRTVVAATLTPTGNDAFDSAAFKGLSALEGGVLPAPPPHYPGPLQSRLKVTFICKREACD